MLVYRLFSHRDFMMICSRVNKVYNGRFVLDHDIIYFRDFRDNFTIPARSSYHVIYERHLPV